jgi:hypothetical protein
MYIYLYIELAPPNSDACTHSIYIDTMYAAQQSGRTGERRGDIHRHVCMFVCGCSARSWFKERKRKRSEEEEDRECVRGGD